jgi:hypothetical protein
MLTIAALQNNVKGPQIAGETYYPEMMYPDGDYNHMHMLREFLTGQWGVSINPSGAMGTFWDTTMTFTLPSDYHGLATSWKDMEFAAYIAQGQENIVTGAHTYLIDAADMWDMSMTASNTGSDYCDATTDISVTVNNDGASTITDFDFSYSINGGASVPANYSGSIAPGASGTISIPGVSLSAGVNVFGFSTPSNVNGGALYNPTASGFLAAPAGFEKIQVSTAAYPYMEDFQTGGIGDAPANLYEINKSSYPMYIVDNQISQAATWDLGAFEESTQSYRFRMYSFPTGHVASLLTDEFDLSGADNAQLTFDWAYGQLAAGETSELDISVSDDCGSTWTSIWSNSGDNLATAGADNQNVFYPQAADWDSMSVDLSAYDGNSALLVRFSLTIDGGNCLYLDNIGVANNPEGPNAIAENALSGNVSVYPNPSNGTSFVRVELEEASSIVASVVDMTGKVVAMQTLNGNGVHTLPTQDLAKGLYYINLQAGEQVVIEKLIIE